MGRRSRYNEKLAIEIAARVAEGAGLRTVSEDPKMPGLRTLIRWTHEHPEFDRLLAHARLARADHLFEESISIADEEVRDNADAARQRTRVAARQWACARLHPAKYGDRVAHDLAPLPPGDYMTLDSQAKFQMARRVAFLLEQGVRAMGGGQSPLLKTPAALAWNGKAYEPQDGDA